MDSMKVTKLEHATLVLEQAGKTLILDPGFNTRPMDGFQNVVAIVITHNHDDHVHEDQIARIVRDNPDVVILGTKEVADRKVHYLACPSSAPWLKIGDVMDFVAAVKPDNSFPTHNIHLSEQGHQMNNSRIKQVTEEHGGSFNFYQPGESFELEP